MSGIFEWIVNLLNSPTGFDSPGNAIKTIVTILFGIFVVIMFFYCFRKCVKYMAQGHAALWAIITNIVIYVVALFITYIIAETMDSGALKALAIGVLCITAVISFIGTEFRVGYALAFMMYEVFMAFLVVSIFYGAFACIFLLLGFTGAVAGTFVSSNPSDDKPYTMMRSWDGDVVYLYKDSERYMLDNSGNYYECIGNGEYRSMNDGKIYRP